ncbi:hypothetical protein D3C85_1041340 [compost metagenome]
MRVDLGHQALVDPALDTGDVVLGLGVELLGLFGGQARRTVHDLAGENLGGGGQLAGNADLRADIGRQHVSRLAGLIERRGSFQQRFDDAFQHLAVEVLFRFEVVIDVGLGYTGLGGDIAGLAGGKTLVGELFTGCAQNQLSVALADTGHKPLCLHVPPGAGRRSGMVAPALRVAQAGAWRAHE